MSSNYNPARRINQQTGDSLKNFYGKDGFILLKEASITDGE
jgi:hypothetical protein